MQSDQSSLQDNQITLANLCKNLKLEFQGNSDLRLSQVCSIDNPKPHSVGLLLSDKYDLIDDPSIAWVISKKSTVHNNINQNWILADAPKQVHAQICDLLHPLPQYPATIHKTADIGQNVTYGQNCFIGAYAVLYDGVTLGNNVIIHAGVVIMENSFIDDDTVIYPQTSIYRNTNIGKRCIINSGSVIGADGFGFFRDKKGEVCKIPQVGYVTIADDVELGALCSIDRSRFDQTSIGQRTKLDNMVHIAHNASIGQDTMICAQSSVSGSSSIGQRCTLGGQTGIADHIQIANDVMVASSSVTKSISKSGVFGAVIPVVPLNEWWKMWAYIRKVKHLFDRISRIEQSLKNMEVIHDNDKS